MTMNRRQLIQGLAATGTMLAAPAIVRAQQPQLGSAVAFGLDMSTSRSFKAILMDMHGLMESLDDEAIHYLLTRHGGCNLSIFTWSANFTEIIDIVRHAPIRAETLKSDIAFIKHKLDEASALPLVVGSGTDAYGGISYGHLLLRNSGVPRGNVRTINVYTDGDDDGRLNFHPGSAALYAATEDDITTNFLINGAERMSDAMRVAAEIIKGPSHLAMDMSTSFKPATRRLMWIKTLSRDYAKNMDSGPTLG
jgi:hypothetical protein